jgi:hypothetical protein
MGIYWFSVFGFRFSAEAYPGKSYMQKLWRIYRARRAHRGFNVAAMRGAKLPG